MRPLNALLDQAYITMLFMLIDIMLPLAAFATALLDILKIAAFLVSGSATMTAMILQETCSKHDK